MASYKGFQGALQALEEHLRRRMPDALRSGPVNAQVSLLGSADIGRPLNANLLGIYLHRVVVDPHGRSRRFPPEGTDGRGPQPELPVNLHILILAVGNSAGTEADLLGWAMTELANEGQIDVSEIAGTDSEWGERESLTVTPEEMSTEDLMRIWDVFEAQYTNSVPYVLRTVRLRLRRPLAEGPPVKTRVYPGGEP